MSCPRCGWVNPWTDSGDRGAALVEHGRRDCPGVPPVGARVELVHTSDEYTRLQPGDRGTVVGVQLPSPPALPERMLQVQWDSGSGLGLIEGEDEWKVVSGD